jgi:desulfoferrodoxin (superoxide reductase-like protein)
MKMSFWKQSKKEVLNRRGYLKSAAITAFSSLLVTSFARKVEADVPDVQVIENISQDSAGRIRVQIRHANPTDTHYIDSVEVDVEGQMMQFQQLSPQDTEVFTLEFDLGEIEGTPNVTARSHCTIHGWGDWSDQIQIPEFPSAVVVAFGVLAASLLLLKKGRKSKYPLDNTINTS